MPPPSGGADLGFERHEFQDHLHCEEHGEDHIQHVGQVRHVVRLVAVLGGTQTKTSISATCPPVLPEPSWFFSLIVFLHLHSQTHGVEHDEKEHQVLEVAGGDNVPHLVLVRVLRDVAAQRTGF